MTEEVKKGRKSWKPNERLRHTKCPEGYVDRWVDRDPLVRARRLDDGYVPVNQVTAPSLAKSQTDPVTGGIIHRDLEYMVIPKEDYLSHRDYWNEQTKLQTAGLRRTAEQENAANAKGGAAAQLYGKTIIE